MKDDKKKFDAVRLMRKLRDQVNQEIAHLSPDQLVEYFRKHKELFEKEMGMR